MIIVVCVVVASVSGWFLLSCPATGAHPLQHCPWISVAHLRTVHMWHTICAPMMGATSFVWWRRLTTKFCDAGENEDLVSLGFPTCPQPLQRVQQHLVYFSGSTWSTAYLSRFSLEKILARDSRKVNKTCWTHGWIGWVLFNFQVHRCEQRKMNEICDDECWVLKPSLRPRTPFAATPKCMTFFNPLMLVVGFSSHRGVMMGLDRNRVVRVDSRTLIP